LSLIQKSGVVFRQPVLCIQHFRTFRGHLSIALWRDQVIESLEPLIFSADLSVPSTSKHLLPLDFFRLSALSYLLNFGIDDQSFLLMFPFSLLRCLIVLSKISS
jgi:hypothetical protein